ncbi:MAG TPA: flagellar basal-body MS-ring/collar protein FliF [Myxococcota bacterium]|nr:flagellar basal-body MS-ring/collar protein FliF [Myxococcota bacterium]
MEKLFQQVREFYESLEPRRQKMLMGSVAASVLLVVVVGIWANGETWRPVVHGSVDEVSRGAAALASSGIGYRIDDNGTVLEVPEQQLGLAKLSVAASDVVPNYEQPVDVPAHLTPRQQQYFLQRMEETTLAHMIYQLDPVEVAWVNLNEGSELSYIGRDKEASASVMLRVRDGSRLTDRQVRSIVNLVAMAVDELDPGRVSVSDQQGNLLHTPDTDGVAGGGEALQQLQIQQQMNIVTNVTEALRPLLGGRNAVTVQAFVSLDHREEQRMDESINLDQAYASTEQIRDRLSTDGDARGAAGTASNGADSMVGSGEQSVTEETQSSIETTAPRSVAVVKVRPGDIERISVSVLVDERIADEIAAARAGAEADEVALAAARLLVEEQIATASAAAAGFDATRGDVVDVGFLPFKDLPVVGEAPPTIGTVTLPWLPYAVATLALVLTFAFVLRPLVKAIVKPPELAPGTVIGPNGEVLTVDDSEEEEEDDDLAARLRLLVENYESVDAADLNRLVDSESEAAAQVLRQWSAKA